MAGKNVVPGQFASIFRESDRVVDGARLNQYDEDIRLIDSDEPEPVRSDRCYEQLVTYQITGKMLADRLHLAGFAFREARDEALAALEHGLQIDRELRDANPSMPNPYGKWQTTPAQMLEDLLTYVARRGIPVPGEPSDHQQWWLYHAWRDVEDDLGDPRRILALLIPLLRNRTRVVFDVTELVLEGYLERDSRPMEDAEAELRRNTAIDGPIIVVTEGSSDARLLRRALQITHRHLADYFSFLDFDNTNAPGGADRVVSLTRGMAAAGVMNRVIAVLDNDAAGREAKLLLDRTKFPSNFRVRVLPTLPFARRYPTLGPHGRRLSDLNGRACSIELYFGPTVLRQISGNLPVVRWKSYILAVDDYQGEIVGKRTVQEAIARVLDDNISGTPAHRDQLVGMRSLSTLLGLRT